MGAPMPNYTPLFDCERIVARLVELARAKRRDRLLVAGHAKNDILLELHRYGFLSAVSTKSCGLPRCQYDIAMVAWHDHSIKVLEPTLDLVVQFLSPTGVLAIWVGSLEHGAHQQLRLALDRLGFHIEIREPG